MNNKVISFLLICCAAICYARSIYFDSYFLVQCALTFLISGFFSFIRHITSNQFIEQIARLSIAFVLYGCFISITFVTISWYLVWGALIRLCGVGSWSHFRTTYRRTGQKIRGPFGLTVLSLCVVVGLWFGVTKLFFGQHDTNDQDSTLPTYDRISTFSTGQKLTNDDYKSIISTGILPLSGQSFFQTLKQMSDKDTIK